MDKTYTIFFAVMNMSTKYNYILLVAVYYKHMINILMVTPNFKHMLTWLQSYYKTYCYINPPNYKHTCPPSGYT